MAENLQEMLEHHWTLDPLAAEVLANKLEMTKQEHHVEQVVGSLDDAAVMKRDQARELARRAVLGCGPQLHGVGHCSESAGVDNGLLHDFAEELQEEFPAEPEDGTEGVLICERVNGRKPRTRNKTRGIGLSTLRADRREYFAHHRTPFNRGIPQFTEILDGDQLGELAPYLSGVWLGMRDMESTTLRDALSLTRLASLCKNGRSGSTSELRDAILTIRAGSDAKDDSGVRLGSIAATETSDGALTGILPVGSGNPYVGIIARGFELPDNLSSDERRQQAYRHLGLMCQLAAELGVGVARDDSHKVPHMLEIAASDDDRFIQSGMIMNEGVRTAQVAHAERLMGGWYELGVHDGQTDLNFDITKPGNKERAKDMIRKNITTIRAARAAAAQA